MRGVPVQEDDEGRWARAAVGHVLRSVLYSGRACADLVSQVLPAMLNERCGCGCDSFGAERWVGELWKVCSGMLDMTDGRCGLGQIVGEMMSMRRRVGAAGRAGRRLVIWCAGLVLSGALVLIGSVAGLPPGMGGVVLARAGSGNGAAAERTWYVRPDGGDRKQCTGLADAAYRGHGSNQPCAFKHPQMLFSNDEYNNKKWIVAGGDTMVLRGGPYRMGYRGPDPKDAPGLCPGNPYECYMPPVPSGTKERPTRLLGEHFASCGGGCEDAVVWWLCVGAGSEPERLAVRGC